MNADDINRIGENLVKELTRIIFHPAFRGELLFLKIIFILTAIFFFGFIIFALIKTSWLKRVVLWDLQEFLTYKPYGAKRLVKRWKRLKDKLSTGMESEIKLAVIEADSMMDESLKLLGYKGESLGEKLDQVTPEVLSNVDSIREAHKVRNDIIHDPTYKIEVSDAQRVLDVFEKALTILEAL